MGRPVPGIDEFGDGVRKILASDTGVMRMLSNPQIARILPPDVFARIQRGDASAVQEAVQIITSQGRGRMGAGELGDIVVNDPAAANVTSPSGRYRLTNLAPENVADATIDPGTAIAVVGNPNARQGVPVGLFGGEGRQLIPGGPSGPGGTGRIDDIFGPGDPGTGVSVLPRQGGPGVPVGGPAGGPRGLKVYDARPRGRMEGLVGLGLAAGTGAIAAHQLLNRKESAPVAASPMPEPPTSPRIGDTPFIMQDAPGGTLPVERAIAGTPYSASDEMKVDSMSPEQAAKLMRAKKLQAYLQKYGDK